MCIARRAFLTSMTAMVAAPVVLRFARASTPQVTFKLHHFFSSVSGAHTQFLVPWARKIEADSGGRIRIDIFPSMQLGGAPQQLLDQARDGVADIAWAVPGNAPGGFAKIEVFELPFAVSHRALVNSMALQDYAAANLQDEFREVRPLAFSCRDHGVLHANRTIRTIEDIKGLRLHVASRLAAEAVQMLGARGINVPIPQVPMAIAGRVIDGCLDPWDVVPVLHLDDAFKSHTDFADSALSTATFVLAMNKASYERLARDLKTVVDNNSGQVAASMAGAMWDLEAKNAAETVRDRGDPIIMLTAGDIVPWRKATEPVIAAWLREMKSRKVDGTKLIASAQALVAKYADTPEPEPAPPTEARSKTMPQPQNPEPKVAPPSEHSPPSPQAKPAAAPQRGTQVNADVAAPKVTAPAATPHASPAPRKDLDIPL